jgi:hypothetical protein
VVAAALERERAALGAHFLAARLSEAQLAALSRDTSVALRLTRDEGDALLEMVADGNGNGVLMEEIEAGIDVPISAPERLGTRVRDVGLRVNQRVPDIGGAGWLEAGSDPLRVGRTSLVSFSSTGGATAGTLYVACPRGPQLAVRITGATGRIRVLRYDAVLGHWIP